MKQGDMQTIVLETLADIAPDADLGAIDPSISFHDQFGIDSIDFMNLMLRLEQRLQTRIPESDYPKLSNLDGSVSYLAELVTSKPPAMAG